MLADSENEDKLNFARPRSMSNRENQSSKKFSKPPVIKYISKQLLKKTKSADVDKTKRKRSSTTTALMQFLNLADVFQSKERYSPSSSPLNCSPTTSPFPRRKSFNFFRSKKSIDESINSDTDSCHKAVVNRSLSLGNVLDALPKRVKAEKLKSKNFNRRWKSLPNLQTRNFNIVTASPLVFGTCSERQITCDLKLERKHSIKVLLQQRRNGLHPASNRVITRRRSSGGTEDIYILGKVLRFDNERLEQLVSNTLEKNTTSMSFDHELSGIRCRRISKNLENAVKNCLQNDENIYKVVAQVFMGELKGHGICFATQCTYQFSEDYFATSTFQTDDMFVCAIVVVEKV